MKRIFFLFLIMTSMTVVAQESIPQDTTLYLNGRKIIIKEHDGKIKVKMYERKPTMTPSKTPRYLKVCIWTAAALNEPQRFPYLS